MERLEHPHVAIDGVLGPAGTLPAHFHVCCPRGGLTFQCPASLGGGAVCHHIWTISWRELDECNQARLEAEPMEMINLPPCPACGAFTQFCNNDIEYGVELPEHHTFRMIRQQVVVRPAFRQLTVAPISGVDGKHQGRDFSHLPKRKRPPQHQVVDVEAEAAALDV